MAFEGRQTHRKMCFHWLWKVAGFSASDRITEISCHARESSNSFQRQGDNRRRWSDSKVIRLSPDGNVDDFAMNDKCAAGTGRFLEVTAAALEL